MKNTVISRMLLGLAAVLFFSSVCRAEVLKIVVNDTIQPITEEFISRAIDEARRRNDQAILIEMNTPGGLVESTREIIQKITNSAVPVIIYVAPSGSRAAPTRIFHSRTRRHRRHGPRNQHRRGASGGSRWRKNGRCDEREDGE